MNSKIAWVIGAGPAGLSASIGLKRRGYDVSLFEQRAVWTGRVCGAFLNPEAVRHLEWLGVSRRARTQAAPVTQVSITYGQKHRTLPLSGAPSWALPRKTLEEILLEQARSEGVSVHFGKRIRTDEIPEETLIVSAAGRGGHGPTQWHAGQSGWYGWNAVFENVAQKPGEMSMHFYRGGYVGVVTFANGQSNVCGLVHRKAGEPVAWGTIYENARAHSIFFKQETSSAVRTGDWRGVGPLPFHSGKKSDERLIFVGDAAAVGDPFMGEGNGRALSAGPMLYDAKAGASFHHLWEQAYGPRFRWGAWLRWGLFAKSLPLSLTPFLWRKFNDHGYQSKNVPHPEFRKVLPV